MNNKELAEKLKEDKLYTEGVALFIANTRHKALKKLFSKQKPSDYTRGKLAKQLFGMENITDVAVFIAGIANTGSEAENGNNTKRIPGVPDEVNNAIDDGKIEKGKLYNRRAQLQAELADLGDSNNEEIVAKAKELGDEIDFCTGKINFIDAGIDFIFKNKRLPTEDELIEIAKQFIKPTGDPDITKKLKGFTEAELVRYRQNQSANLSKATKEDKIAEFKGNIEAAEAEMKERNITVPAKRDRKPKAEATDKVEKPADKKAEAKPAPKKAAVKTEAKPAAKKAAAKKAGK